MAIRQRVYRNVTILDIEGRLTVETVPDLRLPDLIRRLLQAGRTQIVLNLERVPQLDSSGLTALVESHFATTRTAGALKLMHLAPRVRQVLQVTRLLTIFETYDTETDAVESFAFAV